MIKNVFLYLFIFLLSLLIFLIALLPANMVWEKGLASQINTKQFGVDVQQVAGTLWDGQALVRYRGLLGIIRWDVGIDGLNFSLPVTLNLESEVGHVDMLVEVSMSKVDIEIDQAQIDLQPLTPLFRSQRVTLDGELQLRKLLVTIENERVSQASGMASWSGGDISYPAGRKIHQRSFPLFKAILDTKSAGDIVLGVRDPQATFDVISADLQTDGTAMLRITRRLLDLSSEPWSQNSTEQDVVFKVKKVLY